MQNSPYLDFPLLPSPSRCRGCCKRSKRGDLPRRGGSVDDGGWVILLERMDHAAMTASVELAEGKARSAALFKKPTQALEDAINHGRYAAITARGFMRCRADSRSSSTAR